MNNNMIICTSNEDKIEEMREILGESIEVRKSLDIKEIDCEDPIKVATYKALHSEVGTIVEDTILQINGKNIVDIKFAMREKSNTDASAKWIVTLAWNAGETINIYQSEITGRLVSKDKVPKDAVGFDPYFIPEELIDPAPDDINHPISGMSLYWLKKNGLKKFFSARRGALIQVIENKPIDVLRVSSIPEWNGKYQGEKKS